MPPPALEHVKAIFVQAVEKSGAEREAFLHQACGDNTALLMEVEAFLAASENAGDFLSFPITALTPMAFETPSGSFEGPGSVIGPYKLLEIIGEGGFGSVFMAEQNRPVRRKVALKIIKLGMDTKQVIARFEAERQALAMMEHPNIAKVLEAGATETGRPYFVMELVRGVRITEYCNSQKLTTRQRIELFIHVCNAIQHAHQKGIIHRDIKPSNVLVTMHDDKAVPKIIDFGIAKATTQQLTDKTLFTNYHQFIGTPAYMSPEQAQMSEWDIDTRSDIYSLGVLLYELLTGTTPFDAKQLFNKSESEIQRIIREVEPPRPSTRLNALAQASLKDAAEQRQCDPKQLSRMLRRDLDWIVMKCLEKDRTRRYDAANDLAKDIERYLNNEMVVASPPSKLRRIQKLVRRNKLVFIVAGIVTASMFTGLAFSTWSFFREQLARQQAETERRTAEAEAAKSHQVAQFLEDMLNGVRPSVALGRDTTLLREILDKTAERVGTDLRDQPEVEAELRATIAQTYFGLGLYAKSEAMDRQALALRRKTFGDESPKVAESLDDLAGTLHEENKDAEGEAAVREAVAIQRSLLGPENLAVARSLHLLGILFYGQKKMTESESAFRQALAMRRKILGNDDPEAALWLNGVAIALDHQGKLAEAETAYRQALSIQKKVYGPEHPDMEVLLDNLANILIKQGKLAEAEVVAREVLALQRKMLGDEHPHELRSLWILCNVLQNQSKLAEAEGVAREILARQKKRLGDNCPEVAAALNRLGGLLAQEGRPAEAEPVLRQGLEFKGYMPLGDFPERAWAFYNYASLLGDQDRYVEAEANYRQALGLMNILFGPESWATAITMNDLADLLEKRGRATEAEPLFRHATGIARKQPARQDRAMFVGWSARSLGDVAEVLDRAGKVAEAAALRKEVGLPDISRQAATPRWSTQTNDDR